MSKHIQSKRIHPNKYILFLFKEIGHKGTKMEIFLGYLYSEFF